MSPSRPRAQPLLSLAALLLLAGCEANTAPAGKTERPVGVQRITFESQDGARDFVGVVRARYENDLGFRVAGKIVTRVVNVGDRVHAGDVVARLDPQDLKLQVESAEAELAAATSNLAQAAADLERYTTLRGRGYASVDLTALRDVGRNVQVFIGVQNMFDQISFVQTNPSTTGTPRLFNAGVRVRFSGR